MMHSDLVLYFMEFFRGAAVGTRMVGSDCLAGATVTVLTPGGAAAGATASEA